MYTTGSVSVTNNSAIVTGVGIVATGNFVAGDTFSTGDKWYTILSVQSDTAFTLTAPYTGATGTGLRYGIVRAVSLPVDPTSINGLQVALALKAPLDDPVFTTKIKTPAITLGTTVITATATELNKLAGTPADLTATELGYCDGVTSAIQGQLDGKLDRVVTDGTTTATYKNDNFFNPRISTLNNTVDNFITVGPAAGFEAAYDERFTSRKNNIRATGGEVSMQVQSTTTAYSYVDVRDTQIFNRVKTATGDNTFSVLDDRLRIVLQLPPSSATSTGTVGDLIIDANYIYVCTATNTWKRSALLTW